jgi:hypothetical protein
VQAGAEALSARPYLSLREFRDALASGRIADADVRREIDIALGPRAGELVPPGLTRAELWHQLMVTDADTDDAPGLEFAIRAGIAPECSDRPLWEACLTRARCGPALVPAESRHFRRHRDVLVALGSTDTDVAVHGELIRLGSGFLDQGQAHAPLPGRHQGFLWAVTEFYSNGASAPRHCRGAEEDMRKVFEKRVPAADVIGVVLDDLGVRGDDIEPFLFATALALPGFTGMFARLEGHPEEHHDGSPVTLADFVAVRLLLERPAIAHACQELGIDVSWPALRALAPPPSPRPPVLDASLLWGMARAAGLDAQAIGALQDRSLEACGTNAARSTRSVAASCSRTPTSAHCQDSRCARRTPHAPSDRPRSAPRAVRVLHRRTRESAGRSRSSTGHITFGAAGPALDRLPGHDREPAAHCPWS